MQKLLIFSRAQYIYTAILRKVVGKKASKYTRQDRKVAWVFIGILHIGLVLHIGQVCICARGKFVFPLRGLYLYFYCRISLSEEKT